MAGDYSAAETSLTRAIDLHRDYGSKRTEKRMHSVS